MARITHARTVTIRALAAFAALCACLAVASLAQQPEKPVSAADRAKIQSTRETLRKLCEEVKAYELASGEYPASLDALVTQGLRENVPKDGWGNAFVYSAKSGGFSIASHGADGKAGGAGADADIQFNENGEVRELSSDELQALAKKREEQAFLGARVLAKAEMRVAGKLLIAHRRQGKSWPDKLSDLAPTGKSDTEAAQRRCFTDPWGNEYQYRKLPHDNFAIVCYGADGKEGGKGRDGDFVVTENDIRIEMEQSKETLTGYDESARDARRVTELSADIQRFRRDHNRLPTDLDELRQRRVRQDVPLDRFGNEYIYITFGADEYYVIHLGRDNLPGGIGDSADTIAPLPGSAVSNWGESKAPDLNALLVTAAEQQMSKLAAAAREYRAKNDKYPAALDDIKDSLPGKTVPKDPWGGDYTYEVIKDESDAVTGFRLGCLGRDGAAGGEGYDADIVVDTDGKRVSDLDEE